MSMNGEKHLFRCPIRGEVATQSEEERYRIDCLNYLIGTKKFPKSCIKLEEVLLIYGAGGKNNLRADIAIYNRPIEEITPENQLDSVLYVAEIKVNPKDKDKAIREQLFPIFAHCQNLIYGIYWDSAHKEIYTRIRSPHAITDLPNYTETEHHVTIDDLIPVKNTQALFNALGNVTRSFQGDTKNKHREILKLLITKYYDEKYNKSDLQFKVRVGDKEMDAASRIKHLYAAANQYYKLNEIGDVLTKEIRLNNTCIYHSVRLLQNYSLVRTSSKLIQEFYMRFAPSFLKQDLSQYYTPKEVTTFMTSIVELKATSKFIDPCCGSGDFMVSVIRKGRDENIDDIYKNVYCWDIDEDASILAQINMILNGDGRTEVNVINTLQKHTKCNGDFNFVITNPPFGKKTKYLRSTPDQYFLNTAEVGQLFIERSINLLTDGGILIVIVPNGYLDNPSTLSLREYIFENTRVVGCIALPDGVFKHADAGGKTAILILQKEKVKNIHYELFVGRCEWVGFNHKKKQLPPLFVRDENTGSILYDTDNKEYVRNDLIAMTEQFASFCAQHSITGFKQSTPPPSNILDTIQVSDILSTKDKAIHVARHVKPFKMCFEKIRSRPHVTLKGIMACVSNEGNFNKLESKVYTYIETGDVRRNAIIAKKKLRGWQLPNRAKIQVPKDAILLSKMDGSIDNFLYVQEEGLIASNGFYLVQIENVKERYNFLHFVFSHDYLIQMEALATGTIMADVKIGDLLHHLCFPTDNLEKNYLSVREYLHIKEKFENSKKAIGLE